MLLWLAHQGHHTDGIIAFIIKFILGAALLCFAGQEHRGAAVDGDSLLRPPRRTQTQRLVRGPVLHSRHIHTSNSSGEYNQRHLKCLSSGLYSTLCGKCLSFAGNAVVCCRLAGLSPEGGCHPRLQSLWGNQRQTPSSLHSLPEEAVRLKALPPRGWFFFVCGWCVLLKTAYTAQLVLRRNRSWPCGVCGHLVTRSSCPTTRRLQWDIRSCGPPSPTGGPTSAQHREWSVTWTGTKTWDVQVSFIYTLAHVFSGFQVCFVNTLSCPFCFFSPHRRLLRLRPEPDGWSVLHHQKSQAIPADADLQ